MILEGNERGFGAELARHLLNPRDNDHVTVHAIEGFVADDLYAAFAEAEAISGGTQCQNYLFSLSLNPPPGPTVSIEMFEAAITVVGKKLGLSGQPRAVVFHEKLGRRHAHCVWSRIDAGQMKAIKLSHYKRKLMDISRELYRTHEWDMPQGFRDPDARDGKNFSRQEAGQARRAQADPKELKALFRRCWDQSDSRSAFAAALWEEGYMLARGDRRGLVAVDASGKIWSLSRWCGVKPKELRARFGSEDALWSIEEAKAAFREIDARAASLSNAEPDPDAEHRRKALVERQRRERQKLRATQEARRIAELKVRQKRLPMGLKAIWARVTGRYQTLVASIVLEAKSAEARDRQEQQDLIDQHLSERRALERDLSQPDILQALSASFETAIRPDPRQKLVLPPDDIPFTKDQLIADPALILDHISHKKARFSRTDVLRELAKRIPDPMALRAAADTAMSSTNLIQLGEGGDVTTRDYRAAEIALSASGAALSASKSAAVDASHIKLAIRKQDADMQKAFGGRLSEEQRSTLHHILGPERLACVVGLAGAGKSTMLKTARAAWEKQGITVQGAALAGKAAEGLKSASGITSCTLASLEASWKNGYEPIAPGDVLVVDEAGMIGTRQMMRIASKLQSIGAKLVLVGDPDQLQPIEAGHPFRRLIETHGAAKLNEIYRQREDWQKQASRDLSEGRTLEAIESYDQHGLITNRWSRDTALAALVEDYMADVELNGDSTSRLAFAHRRKDVYALNQVLRSACRSSGTANPETIYDTETGPRAFAEGDRMVFTRNEKTTGVKNGMLGTVIKFTENQITVELDSDDGQRRKVSFNPKIYRAFDHGYAVTIHKSQGVTIDRSYILASRTMDAPLTYVAMTRHRDRVKLYINGQDRRPCFEKRSITQSFWSHRRRSGPRQ
ncbi:AAA family ATPase [Leisingera aquaemixtae]|uniref:Multifunctional conjugation protein TraI n=1 Tax=Leisingera aquaemixtae TaxID=1396826 RepID=A0A0P1HW89_9RHOB|nr:AAA family ATPase [Leisingera aquaemixtae]CUH99084.1 Multifunctional conjugation protein TraI [Leisingera aquaemixtae]